jgi:hypothetical protein
MGPEWGTSKYLHLFREWPMGRPRTMEVDVFRTVVLTSGPHGELLWEKHLRRLGTTVHPSLEVHAPSQVAEQHVGALVV